MIFVARPSVEPADLGNVRMAQLPGIRARIQRGESVKSTDFKGYGVVKPVLAAVSDDKCWYCERKVEVKYDGVDHRRPKTEAKRGAMHPTYGYWWLAWTWENLLFACDACNKAKGTKFPLTESSVPLPPEIMPPGQESALLLDPCVDDPLDHIQFVQEKDGRWRPQGNTDIGRKTIEVLHLDGTDRPKILDHYRDHVNGWVRPLIEVFRAAMKAGDMQGAQKAWSRTCRTLLRKSSPYAALSYAALNVLVSPEQRAVFPVPRPPYAPGDHVAT